MSFSEVVQGIVTFGQLKQMYDAEIANNVTKDLALRISKNSVVTKEASGIEVIQLWTQKLLKIYAAQFATDDWLALTDCIKTAFQTMSSIAVTEEHTSILKALIQDSLQLLQWVQALIPKLDLSSFSNVMRFLLSIVKGFLSFRQKWKNARDSDNLSVLSLYYLLLKTLDEHVTSLNVANEKEFVAVGGLITSLCELCEKTTLVDIKNIVETWKVVAKLIGHCFKWVHLQTPARCVLNDDWAKRPMCLLLKEIYRNINVIYCENTLQQPVEQVKKYLRVTNFYVKLLHRLTTDFSQDKFPAAKEFIKTYKVSKLIPKYLMNTEISKVTNQYVQHGLGEIFLLIYKNCEIRDLIMHYMRMENPKDVSTDLPIEYLRASVTDNDTQYVVNNVETYTEMFEQFFKDPEVFVDEDHYNIIVDLYATLAILCPTAKMKMYFRKTILLSNFSTAFAGADVLLIISHYCQTQNATINNMLLAEFHFWRQCNGAFSLLTQNARQLYVQELLMHFFRLCKANSQINKSVLWDEHGETQLAIKSYGFFLALGLETTSYTETTQQLLNVQLTDELFELLNDSAVSFSTEQYYKMIIGIRLLSTIHVVAVKSDLLERIFELVGRIIEAQKQSFQLFLIAAFKLATVAVNASTIRESTLEQIIHCIGECIKRPKMVTTASMLLFLSACSRHGNAKINHKAKSILTTVASVNDTELWWNVFLPINVQPDKDIKVDMEVYRDISCCFAEHLSEHICTVLRPKKRMLFNGVNNEHNLKYILNELEQKSKLVLGLSNSIDSNDCRTLHDIVNNLNSALQKEVAFLKNKQV